MPQLPERSSGPARWLTFLAGALALAGLGAAPADELKPYEATYRGIWHGMTVAVSTLKLEQHRGHLDLQLA